MLVAYQGSLEELVLVVCVSLAVLLVLDEGNRMLDKRFEDKIREY